MRGSKFYIFGGQQDVPPGAPDDAAFLNDLWCFDLQNCKVQFIAAPRFVDVAFGQLTFCIHSKSRQAALATDTLRSRHANTAKTDRTHHDQLR